MSTHKLKSITAEIKVDWYTQTGKWYCGGMVEVSLPVLDTHKLKQDIVDNQSDMSDNWINSGYFVVISTTDTQDEDSHFMYFCNFLLMPDAFAGMIKSKKEAVNT